MRLKLKLKTWWRWRCGKVESWQATEVNPLSGRVWNECTWVNDCYIVLVQSSMNRGQWLLHCLCAVINPPPLNMMGGSSPPSLAYFPPVPWEATFCGLKMVKHCQRHNGPRNWLRNLDWTWQQYGTTYISCKFGHQMAPLALVANLATRWRHLH